MTAAIERLERYFPLVRRELEAHADDPAALALFARTMAATLRREADALEAMPPTEKRNG